MTVSELIQELKNQEGNAQVYYYGIGIPTWKPDNTVLLYTLPKEAKHAQTKQAHTSYARNS